MADNQGTGNAGNTGATGAGDTSGAPNGGAAAGGNGNAGAGANTTAPATWISGLSDDHRNFAITKGFDKDPNAIVHSFKHLEGLIGQKERVVLLPDEKDPASAEAFYNKIGRPEKPEGYGITAGEKGDPKFVEFASKMFHEAGLSKKQAETVVGKWSEFSAAHAAEQAQAQQQAAQVSASNLKKEWGGAFEQNVEVAKAAAQKFGLTPEVVTALEKSTDYATVMKFMHQVGTRIGEPTDLPGATSSGSFKMTPAQAEAKKSALLSDTEWAGKFMSGSKSHIEEMSKLNEAILG